MPNTHIKDIGQEVASRRLDLKREGVTTRVLVRIGLPYPDHDQLSFHCPFEISGFGERRLGYAVGVDAIQALQLVMQMIDAELDYLAETNNGKLSLEDGVDDDSGFPL
jgi:hypothetical protein